MWTKILSGLKIQEIKVGAGCIAVRGSGVTIRYTGYLNRGEVFQKDLVTTLVLGERNVIAGLERGVEGMRVGGIRQLRVSPHLGYRERGVPGIIPVNAKLVFEVELLQVVFVEL